MGNGAPAAVTSAGASAAVTSAVEATAIEQLAVCFGDFDSATRQKVISALQSANGSCDECMAAIPALELKLAASVGADYTEDNRKVADVNEKISAELADLIPITRKVGEEVLEGLGRGPLPRVSFSSWTTTRAAQYFIEGSKCSVSLLNFASGFCPGGGYLRGFRTQEEDLCRMMPFYHPSLMTAKEKGLYPFGPAEKPGDTEGGFTGAGCPTVLVTPDLSIWRTDDCVFRDLPLRVHKAVAVASPCLARRALNPAKGYPYADVGIGYFGPDLMEKMLHVIFAAGGHEAPSDGTKVLIAGALGCGDFSNDPVYMASALVRAIHQYGHLYDEVHVPLPIFNERDKQNGNIFYQIMKDAFSEMAIPPGISLPFAEPSEGFYSSTLALIPVGLSLADDKESEPYSEAFLKGKSTDSCLLLTSMEHWQQLHDWNRKNWALYHDGEFTPAWRGVQWRRGGTDHPAA